jgi:hypothetical protein
MSDWMAGLGAGLQSFGGSAMQILAQMQARKEREEERKRLEQKEQDALTRANRDYDQRVSQWAFQNNLTPYEEAQAQRGVDLKTGQSLSALRGASMPGAMGLIGAAAGDAITSEAQQQMNRGRSLDVTMSDGSSRKLFQRYEDSPEGRAEATARREETKALGAQQRALDLERQKKRLDEEKAFNTLNRLGQVPKGVTFNDAQDESWTDLLAQYRDERMQNLRNRGAAAGAGSVGTMTEFTDDKGNVWNRNSRTGQLTPVVMPDGTQAKAPPKNTAAPTESEMKAAAYAQRMLTAQQTIEGMADLKVGGEPSRAQAFLQAGGGLVPDTWAEGAANRLRTPEQQVYNNAVSDFINAVLRRDSGAAISAQEWARYAPMFTDRPDDSPEAKAQKRANRAAVTQLMVKQAGKAWSPDLDRVSSDAASAALMPWSQRNLPSPTDALRNRR